MTQRPTMGDAVVQRIVELGTHAAVAPDAWLVFRQERVAEALPRLWPWEAIERRPIGRMAITILSRAAPAGEDSI